MDKIKIYNTIPPDIDFKPTDIYYLLEFAKLSELSEFGIFEILVWDNKIIYPYIKKSIFSKQLNQNIYHICPIPGYGGPIKINNNVDITPIDISMFEIDHKNYCNNNSIITECIRYSPYNPHVIYKHNHSHFQLRSKSVIVDLSIGYNNYLKKCSKSHIRAINSGLNRGFTCKIIENPVLLDIKKYFIDLYEFTMKRTNAKKYYFYNDEYYNMLLSTIGLYVTMFVILNKMMEPISSALYLCYDKYMNYHLGGSYIGFNNRGCNDLLHDYAIRYGIEHKYRLLHLGYGMIDNDSLFHFKKQIGTDTVDYYIAKNIFNNDIYNIICKEYNVDPDDLNYLPPYIKCT